nr:MAG TPA: hypothetical protein [Caudoviricetes sp.]
MCLKERISIPGEQPGKILNCCGGGNVTHGDGEKRQKCQVK